MIDWSKYPGLERRSHDRDMARLITDVRRAERERIAKFCLARAAAHMAKSEQLYDDDCPLAGAMCDHNHDEALACAAAVEALGDDE